MDLSQDGSRSRIFSLTGNSPVGDMAQSVGSAACYLDPKVNKSKLELVTLFEILFVAG